jgi:hypothetical protein
MDSQGNQKPKRNKRDPEDYKALSEIPIDCNPILTLRRQTILHRYLLHSGGPRVLSGPPHLRLHHLQLLYPMPNAETYLKTNFPTDSDGNLCGVDAPGYPFVYFANAPDIVLLTITSVPTSLRVQLPRQLLNPA